MKNIRTTPAIAFLLFQFALFSSYGQVTVVYDSLDTAPTTGVSDSSSGGSPIHGDTLTLSLPGTLGNFGISLYNSISSAGPIMTGTTTVKFYDNTIPYTSGPINNPLLGTATFSWNFGSSGLAPQFYSTKTVDLSGLNIVLPQSILITQQFNQTSGTSTAWGVVSFSNSAVGSSPNTVYVNSIARPSGLYTVSGPGQIGYYIEVTPSVGNHPPIANPQNLSVNRNTSLPITLTATDADNDFLTYSIATQPANGTLSGLPPNVVYLPNFNYSGPDSFTFTANDGQTNSAPATISITVNGPLAGLVIVPSWDSTILNDPNATTIENTINAAILVYETKFSDPITVNIKFAEMSSGLGQSTTFFNTISYQSFYNALLADSKTTNDVSALANIPNSTFNPVDGSSSIEVTTANQRALGLSANLPLDGTVYLNMSIINISRATNNLSKYDLIAVVSHEIDEVLGTASSLGPSPEANSRPADLFRYNSSGFRSYTTSGDDAWFSIDGGTTRLVQYNQDLQGDFGDWKSKPPFPHTPRVQDAFGTAGALPNLGVELTVLDVVGYDLVIPAPIPTIQNVTMSGGTINFSWASAVSHGYQVQYKTNLTQAVWLNLNSPIVAIDSVTSSSDTIGPDPRRFYRIALLSSSPAPPSAPLATHASSGPFMLATNYFLPEQAAEFKGQTVKSRPALEIEPAKPFKGEVRVDLLEQK
jgi:hypothetical protein